MNQWDLHVPPRVTGEKACIIQTVSAAWCTPCNSSIKPPEGFIGVNVRLWWRENMSDVVYCHFYLDLFFLLKPLLHIHCIFQDYTDNDLNKAALSMPMRLFARLNRKIWTLLSSPCLLLYVNFPWNLSIFDMALCANTPLLWLMSSRHELHWLFWTFLGVQTYFTSLFSDQWQLLAK